MKYQILLSVLGLLSFNLDAIANDKKLTESIGIGISDTSGSTVALKFIPPDEEGWSAKNSGLSVTLRNGTDKEDDSREIEAYLIRIEAPISSRSDYIQEIRRNAVEGYANSKEFKIGALEITEDSKDARCVRVHLVLEGVQPEPVIKQKRWIEQYVLSCVLFKHKGPQTNLRGNCKHFNSLKPRGYQSTASSLTSPHPAPPMVQRMAQ